MHIGRDDLGRHVPEDTHAAQRLIVGEQHAHARRLLLLESKRKPKVNQHHVLALLGHNDVACLHVAVYDAPLVQVRKHLGELPRPTEHLVHPKPELQMLSQVDAVHEAKHQESKLGVLTRLDQPVPIATYDVGMLHGMLHVVEQIKLSQVTLDVVGEVLGVCRGALRQT